MAMNVLQSPSRPGLGKVSGFFWRNPGLGLFLLLLGPLMWFGIVYFGSLLTLLWQGFYTFDDFTMSVTPELTLANIRALFNPANYDIIVRTLTMAVAVTIASAILAFPMAWYMARYTSGKMKAFFYIDAVKADKIRRKSYEKTIVIGNIVILHAIDNGADGRICGRG